MPNLHETGGSHPLFTSRFTDLEAMPVEVPPHQIDLRKPETITRHEDVKNVWTPDGWTDGVTANKVLDEWEVMLGLRPYLRVRGRP